MYCGDETASFVGDVGSHVARFGYGGEDAPKHVVPSYRSTFDDNKSVIPTSCYNPRFGMAETKSILRAAKESDGGSPVVDPLQYLQQGDHTAQNWDAYEHVWQSAFDALAVRHSRKHTTGRIVTDDTGNAESTTIPSTANEGEGSCVHPLLVVSPGCTHNVGSNNQSTFHRKELVQITELMMETMNCRALFVAPTPMLSAFCYGRQTALVVDVGAAGTRVTPVVDGLLLKQAQRRNGRGGDWLGNVCWKALEITGNEYVPRYQLLETNNEKKSGIFHRWAMQDVMYEFRTNCEHVKLPGWAYDQTVPFADLKENDDKSSDNNDEAMDTDSDDAPTYELPDGTQIDLSSTMGRDLCRLPELLFTGETPFLSDDGTTTNASILKQHPTLSNRPIHHLIHDSLSAVGDVDVRKELANNIVLCGGSSLIPGLEKRLSLEISYLLSSNFKPKVLASKHSVERSCAAWIGGSILTNLGSFQQLWLSKDEYEEYGVTLAVQRFP